MAQQVSHSNKHRKKHQNSSHQNMNSSGPSITHGITMITSNPKQPYNFAVSIDVSNQRIRVQAKNKFTKDAYYGEYSQDQLKKMGFHQSIKGFHNRLKLALESKQPEELRAYYRFYLLNSNSNSNNNSKTNDKNNNNVKNQHALLLTLEESSKYDDDSVKWSMPLKQLLIKDTVKLSEKLEDVADTVHEKYNKTNQKLDFIVSQVKEKFNKEKEERQKLEQRVEQLEILCKKLAKKTFELQNELNQSHSMANDTNTTAQTKIDTIENKMNERITTMETQVLELDNKFNNQFSQINKDVNEMHPKLVRLKSRKEFNTEQGFVEYIQKTLDTWDSEKYGPLLVRVNSKNATGKAKHFIGYVGEPQKWNDSICKVQWFGLGKMQAESVEWKALDVFLPLSAYSYPDCPHARLPQYSVNSSSDKM